MPTEKLVILCTGEFSFGQMMSAYIQFYSNKKFQPLVFSRYQQHLHPLAIQVMKEDGIHIGHMKYADSKTINEYSAELAIRTYEPPENDPLSINSSHQRTFKFQEPASKTVYNEVLENFRYAREEIKRASIEMVGALTKVPT